MSPRSKWEYMKAIYSRYHQAKRKEKTRILDEFCKVYGCHRKHAIRLLKGPPPCKHLPRRHLRKPLYGSRLISILQAVWEASGYLWSKRLKAALPLWLPWIRRRFQMSPQLERQLLSISPAQIDRRLKAVKHRLRRRINGRTKPGTLLKYHIPIKTDAWDVRVPGFTEVDLMSHSGDCAEREGTAFALELMPRTTRAQSMERFPPWPQWPATKRLCLLLRGLRYFDPVQKQYFGFL